MQTISHKMRIQWRDMFFFLKKNQMERLELKSTIPKIKKSISDSTVDLNWQKKESVNLNMDQ